MKKHRFADSTTVGRLLNKYEIPLRVIGRAAGVGQNTVKRVMDLDNFMVCLLPQRNAVRAAVERLLAAYSPRGLPEDLWHEFDEVERQHEAAEDAAA